MPVYKVNVKSLNVTVLIMCGFRMRNHLMEAKHCRIMRYLMDVMSEVEICLPQIWYFHTESL